MHLEMFFSNNFSTIETFESMQTMKYGTTNYSNCSKCCPLALTQAWSHFLHWSMVLSMMVYSKSAQNLTSSCFSSATSCIGFSYTVWCNCCHWNRTGGIESISTFSNAINQQLNVDAFCEKSFITDLFLWLCQPLLGVQFFRNTVYIAKLTNSQSTSWYHLIHIITTLLAWQMVPGFPNPDPWFTIPVSGRFDKYELQ